MNEHWVYRILTDSCWAQTRSDKAIPLSELDRRDGYIHLSTYQTVLTTANLYFRGVSPLWVAKISVARLGASLRWDWVPQREAFFPHLYHRTVALDDIHSRIALILHAQNGFEWGLEHPVKNGET